MDSSELNKVFAAVLTAGVIAGTAGLVSKLLMHEEKLKENVYIVDLGPTDAGATVEDTEELQLIGPLLASADADAGAAVARRCGACHGFDEGGANRVGPNLWAIMGKPKAASDGYAYSEALAAFPGEWGYEEMNQFLVAPTTYVPGTKMNFAGLRRESDRVNLIAWMRLQAGDPLPLPSSEAVVAPAAEAEAASDAEQPDAEQPVAE
jgi:cytochrome c